MSYEDGMPAGGNSRFRGYPARMSERQQLALLLQMTSQEIASGGNRTENTTASNTTSRSSSLQQRGSKGRWTSKNGESAVQASINRKEDFRVRQMLVNGYDINAKEGNDITGVSSPDENTAIAPDSPCSPAETSASAPSKEQEQEQQQLQIYDHHSQFQQQQQRTTGSAPAAAPHVAEDSGAPCEMRRTPPQNKVDRSGTGQSGSSPRVTLRLNQVRGARDEKKGGGATNSRQGGINAQNQGQMETSSKTSSNVSSGTVNAVSGSSTSGNTSSTGDSGDVYEFKSSKEPTPVRGASSSPNPNPEKDKDGNKSANNQGSQSSGNNVSTAGSATTSSGETATASITTDDAPAVSASPSSKRAFESDNAEEQDEEIRRKKRKDSEPAKENLKGTTTGRQSTGRNSANTGEKCTKSGKQGSGATSSKNNQNTTSISTDRKSPSTSSMASSPKPSNPSGSTMSSKTTTPAPPESDGEDDRSKGSDSNSAPKVPPLKIVIPQSTTSEQEQGNRNGKSTSNRSHQLPYVVASSNSNDSTDKEQSQSTSGTTSPTESGNNTKNEDKKDFSGALHGEERSTHHQRVLRSSHRSGNGSNGSATLKETSSSSGNGSYSNSSPLPVTTSTDRSNNSSPQQRHHSPTPETPGSESNKNTSTEVSNCGTTSKTNIMTEKSEKNNEISGKCQKDSGTENSENTSTTTSSTTSNVGTPAPPVELHPRKRKMKPNKEAQQAATAASNEASEATNTGPEVHPHDQPITNCYQLFLNIRKQIERRRKGLFPVQPKPPQGFKDYLMNRCTYVLAGNANKEPNVNPPVGLQGAMKDLYIEQEKERYRLRMQHVVEKEKLVLSVEQEILRVHGRAARALANQSLPFSVCTILKDEEVYNVITPEQEEKDRNARSRYNGRLFLSWLQDVDDKWEKIKEAMLLRHHNEAESLHAVQRMDWEWKLKEVGLCEFKATPQIEDIHVPMVHVSDDFDLLPA
ncbi:ankyrin repeat domain-containing protein 12 isoform X1 [Bombus vosnesenskii]|uniref:Ankyrin repeat domain-containing protein 12 isoform X1 n=2 Tax=Bombus vosnesenskii TaxID=207650 RepID=A0A6J3KHN5_9HYME|nr:ankyrin repeat domain-containing protein 12 isoform X1 [Bombus vosnesenskii]XP_050491977.1 ankyrin repeat domain-containing protein 12 isoform X1 [Bombus huntii]